MFIREFYFIFPINEFREIKKAKYLELNIQS